MKSLFILQLVCCVITAMLALQLAMASLQVRWKVGATKYQDGFSLHPCYSSPSTTSYR